MIEHNHKTAERVLAHFEELFGEIVGGSVDTYRNGRERGFSLSLDAFNNKGSLVRLKSRRYAFFCEFRRSDQIVVYIVDDAGYGGEITEEAYDNAKFFGATAYKTAARYIFKRLTEKERWA
jgi:hypothetical protein